MTPSLRRRTRSRPISKVRESAVFFGPGFGFPPLAEAILYGKKPRSRSSWMLSGALFQTRSAA